MLQNEKSRLPRVFGLLAITLVSNARFSLDSNSEHSGSRAWTYNNIAPYSITKQGEP